MKRAILAATALIASSFTPIAVPALVSEAAALGAPDTSLCTDTSLLGPSKNGNHWGAEFLPFQRSQSEITFGEPFTIDGNIYHIAYVTITTPAITQRCIVLNSQNHPILPKYQDVEYAPSESETLSQQCLDDSNPFVGFEWPYCSDVVWGGSSGDTRKPGNQPWSL
jgi:hypothetical protein